MTFITLDMLAISTSQSRLFYLNCAIQRLLGLVGHLLWSIIGVTEPPLMAHWERGVVPTTPVGRGLWATTSIAYTGGCNHPNCFKSGLITLEDLAKRLTTPTPLKGVVGPFETLFTMLLYFIFFAFFKAYLTALRTM